MRLRRMERKRTNSRRSERSPLRKRPQERHREERTYFSTARYSIRRLSAEPCSRSSGPAHERFPKRSRSS
jgi:hypothetical protein